MGNIFKCLDIKDDFDDSDDFSDEPITVNITNKNELITYLTAMRPKNIGLSDNFDHIELDNTEFLPMAIELYEKLYRFFGEYKPIDKKLENVKRKKFFVKPKFGIDAVEDWIKSQSELVSECTELDTNLLEINPATITMKTGDITLEEYNLAFNKPTSKKDMMGINKIILKDMSNYLKIRFINIFNKINPENINNMYLAKSSFVYKVAKHGPLTEVNSFRQILSLPHTLNHFHRILNLRLNEYMLGNKYIDITIQKGGVSGQKHSIFEQYYKLKNVLKNANTNKKKCAILFLDLTNAFGSIKLEKLYEILKLYNVDGSFITYVKEFYSHLEYYIDMDSVITNKWKDGLMQGCSMSPLLFIIALNYILDHMNRTYVDEMGYEIKPAVKLLLTAYVDDICIICKDVKSAQMMYFEFERLCHMLGLSISKPKCAIMAINDENKLDIDEIKQVSTFKYLGEYLSIDGSSTENYIVFVKILSMRLHKLDKTTWSTETKVKVFVEEILPWIQRKTLLMYDINKEQRLKIAVTIKPYTEKWEITEYEIFTDVSNIINNSEDSVIKEICDMEVNSELEKDIEIANYVYRNSNINYKYSQIDENFAMELELDNLAEYVDK